MPSKLDPGGEGLVYGQKLPYVWVELERIAKQIGTTPLGAFVHREPEWFEEMGEDPPEQPEWRETAEFHKAVSGLLQFFREATSDQLLEFGLATEDREEIVWDLTAFEAILRLAREKGDRTRIEIG